MASQRTHHSAGDLLHAEHRLWSEAKDLEQQVLFHLKAASEIDPGLALNKPVNPGMEIGAPRKDVHLLSKPSRACLSHSGTARRGPGCV